MSVTNILHVRIIANAGGGPEKTILRCKRYLSTDKYNVSAAYIHPAGLDDIDDIKQKAEANNLPLFTIPEHGALDIKTIIRLVRLCKQQKIDIWHSHDYKSDILGLIVRCFHKMKLITTVHGFTCENYKTRFYAFLNRLAFRGFDRLISVSTKLRDECIEQGIDATRIRYIPNGIDAIDYSHSSADGMDSDKKQFTIGLIGRFSPEKGVHRAIEVLKQLIDNGLDVHMHLVGSGPEEHHLKMLTNQLELSDNITWWGWQDNPKDFYKTFDLLLLPSYTEGFPNVLLEAMINKVAIAATNVGGIPDMLDQGDCGILLDNDVDISEWVIQIKKLIEDNQSRSYYISQAYDRVMQNYTLCQRTKRLQHIYEELVAA
ncbi:glycosyltransferase [Planctomycetota bacterium]|nr:glycosyltransferase [Planctomycetota bacterium]